MAVLPEVDVSEIPKFSTVDVEDFDPEYLQSQLNVAVAQINVRWGSVVADRLRSGVLPLELYKDVVVRVVSRKFRNEDGLEEENEGQYGYKLSSLVGAGYLWFTDIDELDLTGRNLPKRKSQWPMGTATIGRHVPRWS